MTEPTHSALCAIAKNEAPYIKEWLAFHLALGFDHIIVYDNESTDGGFDALKMSPIDRVEIRDWKNAPNEAPQYGAYNDCLRRIRGKTRWLMYLDLDEFLNLRKHVTVNEFLATYAFADAVAVNWRIFGSAGLEAMADGLVIDRFQMASHKEFGVNAHIKTVFKPEAVIGAGVHSPIFAPFADFVTPSGRVLKPEANTLQPNIEVCLAQINHYFTKSREEFQAKRLRGRADVSNDSSAKFRVEEEFAQLDANDEEESSILRFRDRMISVFQSFDN